MSYYEPSEWDENESSELEPYEENETDIILRSEASKVLASLNRGIVYQNLELENIL